MPIVAERLRVAAEGAGRPLLDNLSCTFESGTVTLIVGRNGSGKSTLLDALGGLIAFEGAVTIDGLPLAAGKAAGRGTGFERLGQVFQYPEGQLFARTVQGEFDYSLRHLKLPRAEARRRTDEAMREMGLDPALKSESPLLLSGGQKRRVALATTFAAAPDWLLLDEPTAGLDPEAASLLLAALLRRKAASGGLAIATHDLDLLLPVADRVVALLDGAIAFDLPAAELAAQPHLWERARLGKPLCASLAELLRDTGASPAAFPTAAEAAVLLAERLARRASGGAVGTAEAAEPGPLSAAAASKPPLGAPVNEPAGRPLPTDSAPATWPAPAESAPAEPSAPATLPAPAPADRSAPAAVPELRGSRFVQSLDPRAKWLFCLCFTIGLLVQRDWPGLAAGVLLTVGLAAVSRVPSRAIWPLLRPFLWFMAVSVVISGLGFGAGDISSGYGSAGTFRIGAVSFSYPAAARSLFEWGKIVCAMAVGIWLSATTTPFAMKRGIERMLAPLARLRFPVEAISLTGSLLLRFIPVLRREAERFNRIARSRGKRVRASGKMRLRDMPAMLLPLLLSLVQLANDLSLALEARGYTRMGLRRTSAVALQWKGRDWAAAAAGCAVLAVLLLSR